jgi:hypothetical protein
MRSLFALFVLIAICGTTSYTLSMTVQPGSLTPILPYLSATSHRAGRQL